MEKLSSILPGSPRVKSVDMEDAHPVRPGVRSYGRPVGVNPIKDRITLSQQAKDIAFNDTMAKMDPKEARGVKIADTLAKKFFETRVTDGIKSKPASEETQQRMAEYTEEVPVEVQPQVTDMRATTQQASKPAARTGETLNVEA